MVAGRTYLSAAISEAPDGTKLQRPSTSRPSATSSGRSRPPHWCRFGHQAQTTRVLASCFLRTGTIPAERGPHDSVIASVPAASRSNHRGRDRCNRNYEVLTGHHRDLEGTARDTSMEGGGSSLGRRRLSTPPAVAVRRIHQRPQHRRRRAHEHPSGRDEDRLLPARGAGCSSGARTRSLHTSISGFGADSFMAARLRFSPGRAIRLSAAARRGGSSGSTPSRFPCRTVATGERYRRGAWSSSRPPRCRRRAGPSCLPRARTTTNRHRHWQTRRSAA